MSKKVLTDQQEAFLEHLFGDAKGNATKAKLAAGYSPSTACSLIIKSVEDELLERTKRFLVENGPKAVFALVDVMDNPTDLGSKIRLAATKDLLDRIGIAKTEKVEISNAGAFILPPKEET